MFAGRLLPAAGAVPIIQGIATSTITAGRFGDFGDAATVEDAAASAVQFHVTAGIHTRRWITATQRQLEIIRRERHSSVLYRLFRTPFTSGRTKLGFRSGSVAISDHLPPFKSLQTDQTSTSRSLVLSNAEVFNNTNKKISKREKTNRSWKKKTSKEAESVKNRWPTNLGKTSKESQIQKCIRRLRRKPSNLYTGIFTILGRFSRSFPQHWTHFPFLDSIAHWKSWAAISECPALGSNKFTDILCLS